MFSADASGAMYGGLDVAEAVRIGALAELKSGARKPHMELRGIKFNIPIDVPTPSYPETYEGNVLPQFPVWSPIG